MGGDYSKLNRQHHAVYSLSATVRMSNVRYTTGCTFNSGRANKMYIQNSNGKTSYRLDTWIGNKRKNTKTDLTETGCGHVN
jgi:hypothetical protein